MRSDLFSEKKNIKENIDKDPFLKKQLEEIQKDADKLADEPIQALSYEAFQSFYTSGSRKEYEYEYFYHRRRLNDFAILSIVYPENGEYLRHLQNIIWAVLDEFTWALPAHIPRGYSAKDTRRQIDLFSAETAFTLAEILTMLGSKLDNRVAERIKYEVRQRVIEPYLMNGNNGWDNLRNNWAAVCAGSVGAAFLYLAEESEIEVALPRLKNTLNCYLDGFAEDGVCTEGLGYWIYGFGYFTYFAQLLYEYTEGRENLFDNDKVRSIARFPQKIILEDNKTVSFSDCISDFIHQRGLMCFLSKKYDDVLVPDGSSALNFDSDSCFRFAHLIRDFAWSDINVKQQAGKIHGFEYFKRAQWYIKKTDIYDFAAKAGRNDDSHNHNDVGSFLLNVGGKSIITDPGRGEYTADYFSEKRYEYFAPSALAHSVPIINGQLQQAGEMHFGNITKASDNGLEIEFGNAYGIPALQSLIRTFDFYDSKIIMTDKLRFKNSNNNVTEHFVLAEKPVLSENGMRIDDVRIFFDRTVLKSEIIEKTFAADHDIYKTVYIVNLSCKTENEAEFRFTIDLSNK